MSDNIIFFAGARERLQGRSAPPGSWVSLEFTISRDAILARLRVEAEAVAGDVREELGTFPNHLAAATFALDYARERRLLLLDHTAVASGGLWHLRPVATAIHVSDSAGGRYRIDVRPDLGVWIATAGIYPSLDVVGDRACELADMTGLQIVDHVPVPTSILSDCGDYVPDGAA